MSEIRPYRSSDREAVGQICVRTGASGQDATGLFSDDLLLPDIFAFPYLAFQPDLAFVVDTGESVAGYVIGVADSLAYVDWYRREWLPGFRGRHPVGAGMPDRDREMIEYGLEIGGSVVAEVAEFPAHLHIDLVPELQGQGFGRALIRRLLAELRARGVPGVYLTMSSSNRSARAFYDRLGFWELPSSTPDSPALALRTDADV
ncbi:GNAT family N-acetyltransferase [Leifsonia poae]|uniref:GNAT family N-acetyltransferase n=1 Tax=Leifsonia poae TaxID=110933 RepID=UPI001CC1A1A9|nr:GNAT family N-acetyltransferase [Leifsonia poae]